MNESNLRSEWTKRQEELRASLVLDDDIEWSLEPTSDGIPLTLIGGVDVSFEEDANQATACLVVLSFPDMKVVYEDFEQVEMTIPYISGFLAFRESIPFMNLISRVQQNQFNPQVILVDGNGILHPRYFGSASHLGVISGYPTIGVAKSLHCVDGLNEQTVKSSIRQYPLQQPSNDSFSGEILPLIGDKGSTLGVALFGHGGFHSRNPVYVSIGHRLSLETSVRIVKKCCVFRIPEPIRQADLRSRSHIRSKKHL